jgi:predicted nucleic acid-binding protein
MKVYLDMCAWKRPFDDQTQGRILIETTAVIRILDAADAGILTLCNSVALEAENQRNTNRQRRERVGVLLASTGRAAPASPEILSRAEHLAQRGFGDLDALHLAFAEHLHADYFATVDDEMLARSAKTKLGVKVTDVIDLLRELHI